MKFAFIDVEKAHYPIAAMCRVLRVSRAGYYAWQSRPESERACEDRRLGVLVREAFTQSRGTYGSPRIHAELAAREAPVSRERVVRLMQEAGLD